MQHQKHTAPILTLSDNCDVLHIYLVQGSQSVCCLPEIPGVSQVKRGNAGVPILVQYCIPLCITTPPVITFRALNNSSPGVLYSGGMIYNVPRW